MSYSAMKGNSRLLSEDSADVPIISLLDVTRFEPRKLEKRWLNICDTALGPVNLPIFAYRGRLPGPTVGITGAVHGNEVNCIPVIQQFFARLEQQHDKDQSTSFAGTIIGVPVLNVPGFLDSVRSFDGQDLNRLMPGNPLGTASQQYANRIFQEVVVRMDYLFDLHTASAGRQNSLYVRADMKNPEINRIAGTLGLQIIVHNSSPGGSLRGCAQRKGIKAVTIEIGNPSTFQQDLIERTIDGICSVLTTQLGYPRLQQNDTKQHQAPIICCRSYWIFSQTAGILQVCKRVGDIVGKGEVVAEIHSVFGTLLQSFTGPDNYSTVVVGLESNPVAKLGNRIVHLGVIGNEFLDDAHDGHL
ncbi:hypothetical protein N7532_004761 [Penicillium argentinense]|uniref:Succinylglutamate desuccinylase/Aspartoacylase catalytic domain-containing protein n=1 Tax=Penicillium argentinense TaxID=1131581 RepID=A0A9W9FQ00_9EURO|nr:uncharacterized protein N7532_004761 [Penicillium argentinense]KAJ5104232.1 hypothetical protein N7532_004761 [Penicillium argentinense]